MGEARQHCDIFVDDTYDSATDPRTIELVAAPGSGNKIIVDPHAVMLGDVGTAQLKSNTTAISEPIGFTTAAPDMSWMGSRFECAENEALNLVVDWGSSVQDSPRISFRGASRIVPVTWDASEAEI